MIKKGFLFVPPRAANEYLYGNTSDFLFGIPMAAEDSEIAHIDGAFKLLTSSDESVMSLAWKDISSTVSHRLRTGQRSSTRPPPTVTLNALAAYLSGKAMPGMNPDCSVFILALQASDRLRMMWNFDKNRSISLTIHRGLVISNRSKVFKSLKRKFWISWILFSQV